MRKANRVAYTAMMTFSKAFKDVAEKMKTATPEEFEKIFDDRFENNEELEKQMDKYEKAIHESKVKL